MSTLPSIIEAGTLDFTLLSAQKDRAEYRVEDPSIPPMFRRTLVLTAKPNAAGTNVNVAFKLVTPVVVTVNGIMQAPNRRVITGSFTSLQNVIDNSEGKDVADMAAVLLALKAHFVNGSLA